MKKATLILKVLLGLFIMSLFGSEFVLKNQYDKIDKTDPFWNYSKLARGTFHHLKLMGGNVTRIFFSPSPHASVGVLNYWEGSAQGRVKTNISDDTLFLHIDPKEETPGIRDWMKNHTLIAITCPDLQSVNVFNTNLNIGKMKQKTLGITSAGRSRLEWESYTPDFDSINIHMRDSSDIIIEMADEIKSTGTMNVKTLYADVQGHSVLDVGHFQIQSLHQLIGDTAAILLSGYSLKKVK